MDNMELEEVSWKDYLSFLHQKGISYPELMKDRDGNFQPIIDLGLRYKDFIKPIYTEFIEKNFNERTNIF